MRRVLVMSCLCLLGCESAADVVTRRRAAVEKTFADIRALKPRVDAAAEVTEAKVKTAPIVLEGSPDKNAMFVYAEDLAKPGEAAPVNLRTLDSVPLLQCGSLLGKGTYFADTITHPAPSVVTQYLGACERLQYVLVIRTLQYVAPELSLETKRFAAGVYRAEVLVFDLRTKELLGGYPVAAKNDDSVPLLDGDADHTRRLISNLEATVFTALREATKQAIPGALP